MVWMKKCGFDFRSKVKSQFKIQGYKKNSVEGNSGFNIEGFFLFVCFLFFHLILTNHKSSDGKS